MRIEIREEPHLWLSPEGEFRGTIAVCPEFRGYKIYLIKEEKELFLTTIEDDIICNSIWTKNRDIKGEVTAKALEYATFFDIKAKDIKMIPLKETNYFKEKLKEQAEIKVKAKKISELKKQIEELQTQ